MAKVAIVTDSSACLPEDLLRAHEIITVPLTFLFDGELHYDGHLTGRDFYALLGSSRRFPSTASPAPAAFLEAFRQAARTAQSAVCITLPSSFSGTYSAAASALELARQEMPDFPIRLVDSHSLAMCHGFAVLSAARAAQADADMDAVEDVVRQVAARAHLIGALDTLRYLAKSGRVPLIMHWATSLLRIKPILEAEGENVRAAGRVRTMPRAMDRLLWNVERRLNGERPLHAAVMHADAPADAERLAAAVRERFQPEELLVTEFTSVMGAHTGPGFVGLAFFSGEPMPAEAAPVEDADRLEASLREIPPPTPAPALVMVSGLPGSGKSHFSRRLAARHPVAHLDSDALRRALFPHPTHLPDESTRLFAAVRVLMERLLSRGMSVILDATSLKKAHRRPVYEIAERAGARLVIVQTESPPEVARARLEARARGEDPLDASEATPEVYDRMSAEAEPIERPFTKVDTSGDIEPALEAVLRNLAVTNHV